MNELNPAQQELQSTLAKTATLLLELQSALTAERLALTERNLQDLQQATEAKTSLLAQLEGTATALQPQKFQRITATLPMDARAKFDELHNAVISAAHSAKESNTVNGKILARSQQSVTELSRLLNADSQGAIYGEHGKMANPASGPRQGRLASA